MFKVKTLNSIAPVWQGILNKDNYEVGADVSSEDAVIVRSADMHGMELPRSLKCIARAGAAPTTSPPPSWWKRAWWCSTPPAPIPTP